MDDKCLKRMNAELKALRLKQKKLHEYLANTDGAILITDKALIDLQLKYMNEYGAVLGTRINRCRNI